MSKTIAFINQKGGTGKTTSAVNIGAGLTRLGQKVLLVDLDPQANLTYSLGIKVQELDKIIADVLEGEAITEETIIERNGLDIIPSSLSLSETEVRIFNITGKEFLLREALDRLKGSYHFILIDCPPSLGNLTINALTAVKEVYIPLQVHFLALQGLNALRRVVNIVQERLNKDLKITGIIGTQFDKRKNLNKEVLAKIKEHFGGLVFKTLIRDNIALAEAPSYGQTIFEYRLKSHGAEDYLALSKEILKRSKKP